MANIVDSLKKLSVENGTRRQNNNMSAKNKYELQLSVEEAVSSEQNYILAVCGTQSEPEFRICTALSNHSCVIYTVGETLSEIVTLTHNKATIVGIKFSPTSKNVIYTATDNGIITACDLRAKGKAVAEFKDSSEDGKLKPLASFDISCDERLIAGGTEHIGGDTFILFWDIRHTNSKIDFKGDNLLGGYWQSHVDDVSRLSFHPSKQNVLASGSLDGLINVFDLTQPSEDLALTYSLNTESSVDGLGWINNDNLWCTTFTSSLQLWDCEGAAPHARFERSCLAMSQPIFFLSALCSTAFPNFAAEIGKIMNHSFDDDQNNVCNIFMQVYIHLHTFEESSISILKDLRRARGNWQMDNKKQPVDEPEDCYIVKFHPSNALGQPFLLAGSNTVKSNNLRCLNIANGHLELLYNLVENKQCVRDSWLHEKSNSLVTVGEGGIVNIWKPTKSIGVQQNAGQKLLTKIGGGKSRERHHRTKPY